ncbi:MAG: ribosome silencing factor [Actinobacteria bacterium]|nr:ribosome silencing factor [Actinomycetota bacterium]MBV9933480.1 ribosome silencing factor [Actinomycetota bacterium]
MLRLATLAARAASDKLGVDTVVLEVGQVLAITDAFVITSGANSRQVRTIAEEVEKAVKADDGPSPMRVEGLDDARWVLLDYGDFVVHVFLEEARRFYDLERLWSDAPRVRWNDRESGGGSEGDGGDDGDGDQALDAASS